MQTAIQLAIRFNQKSSLEASNDKLSQLMLSNKNAMHTSWTYLITTGCILLWKWEGFPMNISNLLHSLRDSVGSAANPLKNNCSFYFEPYFGVFTIESFMKWLSDQFSKEQPNFIECNIESNRLTFKLLYSSCENWFVLFTLWKL